MRLTRCIATFALGATVAVGLSASPAGADPHVTQSGVVSAVPADYTPNVNDGTVLAIAQTGGTVVIGGDFTSISPADDSTTVYPVDHIAAFTAGTGDIVTSFVPQLDGTVNALLAGPTDGTVYVGGDFTTVDGQAAHPFHLALLDVTTGAVVSGWSLPSFGGPSNGTTVNTLARAGGHLFVGGTFTSINGHTRQGFAALSESKGTIDLNYSTPSFTGHHNYNRAQHCTPSTETCATGNSGIYAIDINPAGTRLVATGDFTTVGSDARDQLALLNLGSAAATVNANWATDAYDSPCIASAFDSYIRGVQFSPDGSYFVVTATGGSGRKNLDGTTARCDSVSRFETGTAGTDVPPTWVDYTGHDTLLSVAITGPVVYVGGHERWLNNSNGADNAGTGAVPRPGMAALDPVNGMPLAWNPGRNPRGAGAFALLATPDGLYVGSDTDRIGPGPSDPADTYIREKIAFFPLTGGATLAANQPTPLPGLVYQLGTPTDTGPDNGAVAVPFNGEAPPGNPITVSGVDDWVSEVRGAFDINDTVYYGDADGNFYKRSFDGATFGDAEAIDPYHDPIWDGVDNNSGGTYDGNPSAFYDTIPSLTSLFYSNGRVYYTLAGDTHMFWRWFEPDSGVMGADVFQTTDTNDWSTIDGAFVSDSTLFFADSATGVLRRVGFVAGEPSGSSVIADASHDWRSHGTFVLKANSTTDLAVSPDGSTTEEQPITLTATVALAADPSTHPAGTVTFYDGNTALNETSIDVDPSTGQEQITVPGLPPSAPGKTLLSATFRSTDETVNDSAAAPIAYTVDPIATTPTVAGGAHVGAKDTCSEPTHDGETVKYTWTADGYAVAGGRTYIIGAVALHRHLGCIVAVSVGGGPASIAKSTVRTVARGPALAVKSRPRLHGHHRVGTTERVSLGKWKPAASSYDFQWYAGSHKIHRGKARTLKLTKSRAGKRLRCVVTAHRAGFAAGHAATNRVKITR